jgi:hypothetical protein
LTLSLGKVVKIIIYNGKTHSKIYNSTGQQKFKKAYKVTLKAEFPQRNNGNLEEVPKLFLKWNSNRRIK